MNRRPWTDADRDLVRRHYADMPTAELAARMGRSVKTVYSVAYKLGLRKSGTYFAAGLGGRAGDGRGTATRFQPGHTTWNKGQRYIAGGRSAETRFKPGQIPHTWKPVGTYRVRQDVNGGYLEQKMTDTGCTRRDWIAVHRMVWEATHGPIPPGHIVAFLPGRKSIVLEEITLDGLELVSRQEMIRRNTIHRYPLEIKQNMRLLGRLKSAVAKKESAR
jgi:hypothetical protein